MQLAVALETHTGKTLPSSDTKTRDNRLRFHNNSLIATSVAIAAIFLASHKITQVIIFAIEIESGGGGGGSTTLSKAMLCKTLKSEINYVLFFYKNERGPKNSDKAL